MSNKMCKIPYVHDFPDYPCPICSPKEFEAYKNMNQENCPHKKSNIYFKECPFCPPKEEVMEDCQKCGSYICKCKVEEFSPKEEIVNDWREELKQIYLKGLPSVDNLDELEQFVSSTEKRVAKEIIGEIEKGNSEGIGSSQYEAVEKFKKQLLSIIKSKYE